MKVKSRLDKKIEKYERKADKLNEKLENAKDKIPKKKKLKVKRIFEEENKKVKHKLYFEEEVKKRKSDGVIKNGVKRIQRQTIAYTHGKVNELEKENSGVEAAHKSERLGESALRFAGKRIGKLRDIPYKRISKLQKKTDRAQVKLQYQKFLKENPEYKSSNPLNKMMQKRRIKKQYVKNYKKSKQGIRTIAGASKNVLKSTAKAIARNPKVIGVISAVLLILIVVMTTFSSCSIMLTNTMETVSVSCYQSEIEDIDKAELYYNEQEFEIGKKIDEIQEDNPGYDEYRYSIPEIKHNPFTLINYLSAKYKKFKYENILEELQSLFNEQYTLKTEETIEKRTRTKTVVDPSTGESREVPEIYDYKIFNITLTVKPLEQIVIERMTDEDTVSLYAVYGQSFGGLQSFSAPVDYNWYNSISSYYGYRKNQSGIKEFNKGIDILSVEGTSVKSMHTGKVIEVSNSNDFGNYLVIEGNNGYTSKYAKLETINVSKGQEVKEGEIIGTSTEVIHIEILENNNYLNPIFFICQ